MVIAHRGYAQVAQENSISAFDAAIKAGAKGIECDIRLTKDNKAIVNHNAHILINGKKIKILKYNLLELQTLCKASGRKLLTLDELFSYIKRKNAEFFLEIKNSSPALVETVIKKIKEENLWKKVHIMGFSVVIKNALKAQVKNPKLQVAQFLNFPPLVYLKKPKKSQTVFLGWLDAWRGSQTLFRMLISPKRLTEIKKILEKNGFKVKGGVINNKEGLKLFKQAGITDIVTDKVEETVNYFKKNSFV